MVGCTCIAFVCIHTSHEVGLRVLRPFIGDMYRHAVLTFGVDDIDGLKFAADNTAVAYLTTHLTIEWGVIENDLIVTVFLLCHLTVTENVAVVLVTVVTHKFWFTFFEDNPVTCLYNSSVACTFFLFLHLNVELFSINSKSLFTADKFGKIEREPEGVKQCECLCTV